MAQGANEILKQAAIVGLTAIIAGDFNTKQFAVDAGFLIDAVDSALKDGDVEQAKRYLSGEDSAEEFVAEKVGARGAAL